MLINYTLKGAGKSTSTKWLLLLTTVCILLLVPQPAGSHGRLRVKFTKYRRLSGAAAAGSAGGTVQAVRFGVTVASYFQPGGRHILFVHKPTIANYTDADTINFGPHLGTLDNPVSIDINTTEHEGKGEIEVIAEKAGKPPNNKTWTPLANFTGPLVTMANTSRGVANPFVVAPHVTTAVITSTDGQRSLELSYWFVCLRDSYGPLCNQLCSGQDNDDNGHYTCDPNSGNKICMQGWRDPETSCKQENVTGNSAVSVAATGFTAGNNETVLIATVSMTVAVLAVAFIGAASLLNYSANESSSSSDEEYSVADSAKKTTSKVEDQ